MTCRAMTSATTCTGSNPTGNALSYDNEGRMATWQSTASAPTQSASFLYDGAGQRVEQVASTGGGATTTTSYIGSLEELATSGSTTTTTAYYGGLAESVNGALSYLLSDGLGSVSEAVATSGSITATQLYGPYGAVRYQSGTLPTSKGYIGQRSDATTSGLDYYGARYYDPVAGQFTSADTTLAGGLNRYGYVDGSPETFIDPSGHELREGDNGEGGGIDGGETNGSSSSGGSDGSPASSSDDNPFAAPTVNGSELTYDAGSPGAIHFDAPDGENGSIDGVDGPDGQLLETNAEIEAQAEANENDRLSQGEQPHGDGQDGNQASSNGPSDAVQQSGNNVKTKTDQVRNANQARNPEAKGPTYGQVTVENTETGQVLDQSGMYKGEGKPSTATHAEVQGTNYSMGSVSDLDPAESPHVRVTITVGNPFCAGCSEATLGGYAAQIQNAAPFGMQVDVAFFSWSFMGGQYFFFGAP